MPAERKLKVFLCYSSEDKFDVREFYNRLSAEGWIYPWLDEEEVLPGMNWEMKIKEAVQTADAVIVFLSHNSVKQEGYVQYALSLVLDAASKKPEGTIFVIPLKLDECELPFRVRSWQSIDYFPPETKKHAYSRLLRSLRMRDDMVNERTGKTDVAHFIASPDARMPVLEAPDFQSPGTRSSNIQEQDIETKNIQVPPAVKSWKFGGFSFLEIPHGKFIIGSKASNTLARESEIPQCPYTIPYNYWISQFPISNEQFIEFAISTKYMAVVTKDWRKQSSYPTVNISWHDAISYTCWLNEVFGREIPNDLIFRLPTEAEWERASRGDFAREWPWGNESLDKMLEKNGPYQTMKNKIEVLRHTLSITEAGTFSPLTDSLFGVADMMGSVGEWTQSLYAPYPYDAHDGREDLEVEGKRVVRGCFTSQQERFSVRSARRAWLTPDKKSNMLGFRIVIAPPIS